MAKTIAISGKGGTGKTTITSMMVRCLINQSPKAILAVDADPNACMAVTLGVDTVGTVAGLREEVATGKTPAAASMGKLQAFELGCEHLLTEAKGFDLIAMGHPEGPGCYCAANNSLRKFLDNLSSSYGFVITDNEAGMEHISRRTTNNVDLLAIVAEPTKIGILTAERIIALTKSLPISIGKIGIIWSKTDKPAVENIDSAGTIGTVPFDQGIMDIAMEGKTIFDLDEASPALAAVRDILQKQLNIQFNN